MLSGTCYVLKELGKHFSNGWAKKTRAHHTLGEWRDLCDKVRRDIPVIVASTDCAEFEFEAVILSLVRWCRRRRALWHDFDFHSC